MAVRFSHTFTGTNGDPWPGFTRVAGAAWDAVIVSNQGGAGTTAAERIYQSDYWPGIRDYDADLDLIWNSAATEGRGWGVMSRLTDDGQRGYMAVLYSYRPSDNTLNIPHVKFFRRSGGTNTTLGSEVDVSGSFDSTALNAGVTLRLRTQTQDDGSVTLTAYIDGTQVATHNDAALPIGSGGTAGIWIDGNSDNSDVLADNLIVQDFEADAPDTTHEVGMALKVNGQYLNEQALIDRGIAAVRWKQSYVSGSSDSAAQIIDHRDWHDPALLPGDHVEIWYNDEIYATGYIRPAQADSRPPEGNAYELHGPKQLAREVAIVDPDDFRSTVYFNQSADAEAYDAAKSDMTIGDILAWMFDNHLEGEDGLRAHGAAPGSGSAYTIPAGLTNGPVLAGIELSGTFGEAIEHLLSYMPGYAWYVNPSTLVHEFHHRPSAAEYDIDSGNQHVLHRIDTQPQNARTVVFIVGSRPNVVYETMSLSNGGLQEAWDTSLGVESDYDSTKAGKKSDSGVVVTFGIKGSGPYTGKTYIQVSGLSMDDGEWRQCTLVFTSGGENGTAYEVVHNTASPAEFIFAETAWENGGPSVSDTFNINGAFATGGRDNLWDEMFSMYQISDANKRNIAQGECGQARFNYPLPGGGQGSTPIGATYGSEGRIKLDMPTTLPLGLSAYPAAAGSAANCGGVTQGPDGTIGDIEIDVPVKQAAALRLRVPAAGFRGTAYSFNEDNWDGDGAATAGDAGVMTPYVVEDANYESSAQDVAYTAYADALLEVLGELPVRADVRAEEVIISDLNGLNKRLTLTSTGDRTTGYESRPLWLMEVRWSWAADDGVNTQALCGTQSSFNGLSVDSVRRAYTDTVKDRARREQVAQLMKMLECMSDRQSYLPFATSVPSPSPICASNVTHTDSKGRKGSAKQHVLNIEIVLEGILSLLSWQKGGTFSVTTNEDGEAVLQLETDDGIFTWDPDANGGAGGWVDADDNVTDNPLSEGGTTDADDMPTGGVEGTMWDAIQAIAALIELQKGLTLTWSIDADGNGVVGFTDENGITNWYNDETGGWATDDGDGVPEVGGGDADNTDDAGPLGDDGPTGYENLGGLEGMMLNMIRGCLANLGKTVDSLGNVLEEGAIVGAGGATVFNPDGTTTPLSPGALAPPNRLDDIEANKGAAEQEALGHTVDPDGTDSFDDIAGQTFKAEDDGSVTPDAGNTTPGGPVPGGLIGNGLGKCGSTVDGTTTPSGTGSGYAGPGGLMAPGDTVGSEGAYYLPPSEQGGQPEYVVLESGDTVPSSTLGILLKLAEFIGLTVHDVSDPIGVVFVDANTDYYVLNPSSGNFEEVEAASGGAGTGVNDGDWQYVSPTNTFIPDFGVPAVRETYLVKTSTGSRANSTGLIDDDHLAFTLPDTGHFSFECFLVIDGDATDDVQVTIGSMGGTIYWAKDTGNAAADETGNTLVVNTTGWGTNYILRLEGAFYGNGGDSFAVQWTSNGSSGVNARMKEGSWMKVTLLD